MARVNWRGVTVDDRTRDMLDEVARLTPDLPTLRPSQGSYNTSVGASAGTHAGGGAVDIRCSNLTRAQALETVRVMRTVGFAAFLRLPSEGPWPEHIHAIAVGCQDLSAAARRQIDGRNANGDPIGLRNGRNGLANNGPDPHRDMGLPVITWEQYLEGDGIVALPRKGDKGEHVEFWQRMLVEAGFDTIPEGADEKHRYDGEYGDWTQAAVSASRAALGSSTTNPNVNRLTPWNAMAIIRELGRAGSAPDVDEKKIADRATSQALKVAGSALTKAAS